MWVVYVENEYPAELKSGGDRRTLSLEEDELVKGEVDQRGGIIATLSYTSRSHVGTSSGAHPTSRQVLGHVESASLWPRQAALSRSSSSVHARFRGPGARLARGCRVGGRHAICLPRGDSAICRGRNSERRPVEAPRAPGLGLVRSHLADVRILAGGSGSLSPRPRLDRRPGWRRSHCRH